MTYIANLWATVTPEEKKRYLPGGGLYYKQGPFFKVVGPEDFEEEKNDPVIAAVRIKHK